MSRTTFDRTAVAAGGAAADGHPPNGLGGEIIYAPDDYDNGVFEQTAVVVAQHLLVDEVPPETAIQNRGRQKLSR